MAGEEEVEEERAKVGRNREGKRKVGERKGGGRAGKRLGVGKGSQLPRVGSQASKVTLQHRQEEETSVNME